MIFNIRINQFAYSQLNIKVSIEAACLLDMMHQKMSITDFLKETIKEGDRVYFWFAHSLVFKEMPMLFNGEESEEAISKKVRRWAKELENLGLIESHKSAKSLKKSMYCFTDLSDNLIQTKGNETDKFVRVETETDKNDRVRRTNLSESNTSETDKFVRGEYNHIIENNNNIEYTICIPNSPKVEFAQRDIDAQNLEPTTIEDSQKKEKKVPPKKEKKADEAKAKDAEKQKLDAKNRTHLHTDFIEIYDKWHEGLKGERIPEVFWKQQVRAMQSIREKFIPLSEHKLPSIGMEATDENIKQAFSTFLNNLKKSLTSNEVGRMTPRFLETHLLEFLEKVRNNHANRGKGISNDQQQLVNKHFAGSNKAAI